MTVIFIILLIVGPIIIYRLVCPKSYTGIGGRNIYLDRIIREGYQFACRRLEECGAPMDSYSFIWDVVAYESEEKIQHLIYPNWNPGIRGDHYTLEKCLNIVESITLYHALDLESSFSDYNQELILDIIQKIVKQDVPFGTVKVGDRDVMISLIQKNING